MHPQDDTEIKAEGSKGLFAAASFKLNRVAMAFCAGALMASVATGVGIGAMSLTAVHGDAPLSTTQVAALVYQKAGIETTSVWPVAGSVYMVSTASSKMLYDTNSQLLFKGEAFDIDSGEDAASMVASKYGMTPEEIIEWRMESGATKLAVHQSQAVNGNEPQKVTAQSARPERASGLVPEPTTYPPLGGAAKPQLPAQPQVREVKAAEAPANTSAATGKPTGTGKKLGLNDYIVMLSQMPPAERAKEGLEIAKIFIPELPDEKLIVYRSPNERAVITVFSDPTCGYCKRLHADVPSLLSNGVTVRVYPYIRGRLDGQPSSLSSPTSFDAYLEGVTAGPLGNVASSLRDAYCMRQDPSAFDALMTGSAHRSPQGDTVQCDTDFRSMKVYGDMFASNRTPVIIIGSKGSELSTRHALAGIDSIQDIFDKI